MSPTSEFMAEVSLAHSYPELFRVTGPLPSLVLRTEDVWQRYKPDSSKRFGALNPGFPFSPYNAGLAGLASDRGLGRVAEARV